MIVDTVCPVRQIKRYGAWSAWPYYLATPEYVRDGVLNVLHHKEYHKNGVIFRKISGKWVKYPADKKSVYLTI